MTLDILHKNENVLVGTKMQHCESFLTCLTDRDALMITVKLKERKTVPSRKEM